jgi:site-specific recombinase XerD
VGRVKGDAKDAHDERRARVRREPTWCPNIAKQQAREEVAARIARERARVTVNGFCTSSYVPWAQVHKRSWRGEKARLRKVLDVLGAKKVDEVTTADIERFLESLRDGAKPLSPASVNRYRDLISGIFRRAVRHGLVAGNPVKGIPKLKEPGGRIVYLPPATPDRPAREEAALSEALQKDDLVPDFLFSLHSGLRWSEQSGLQWRDVDVLTGTIGVGRSKNGYSRRVPMNSVVRSLVYDLAARRRTPDDPKEAIFPRAYRTTARAFAQAVDRAKQALRRDGYDAGHLDGYTWHGNRHTFASRLVMAGADLMTVKELGGWRTLSMVQRYAHLAPGHLHAAVERLVLCAADTPGLARNYAGPRSAEAPHADHVS